jgi:hypothetical protein
MMSHQQHDPIRHDQAEQAAATANTNAIKAQVSAAIEDEHAKQSHRNDVFRNWVLVTFGSILSGLAIASLARLDTFNTNNVAYGIAITNVIWNLQEVKQDVKEIRAAQRDYVTWDQLRDRIILKPGAAVTQTNPPLTKIP